jgi:hypothetical protein
MRCGVEAASDSVQEIAAAAEVGCVAAQLYCRAVPCSCSCWASDPARYNKYRSFSLMPQRVILIRTTYSQ